jgi:hypothetical protein
MVLTEGRGIVRVPLFRITPLSKAYKTKITEPDFKGLKKSRIPNKAVEGRVAPSLITLF